MKTKKTKAATKLHSGRKTRTRTSADREVRETEPKDRSIEFRIMASTAHTVALAGTFNFWDPGRTPLRNEGGMWHVVLPLQAGRYEYRFVVDGQWQEDPAARESTPNPFGGCNSVVVVSAAPPRDPETVITV